MKRKGHSYYQTVNQLRKKKMVKLDIKKELKVKYSLM